MTSFFDRIPKQDGKKASRVDLICPMRETATRKNIENHPENNGTCPECLAAFTSCRKDYEKEILHYE